MKWTKKNDHCYEADTLHGITFEIYRDKIPRCDALGRGKARVWGHTLLRDGGAEPAQFHPS